MTEPKPIPVLHRWQIVCREPGLCVDEQIARVLDRLAPYSDAIAELARRLDAEEQDGPSAVLEVVRYFRNHTDDHLRYRDPVDPTAPWNLFGWHLDRKVLDFLQATGAVLDVDEYDMTANYAED